LFVRGDFVALCYNPRWLIQAGVAGSRWLFPALFMRLPVSRS
jgi:hypothetical protein